MGCNHSKKKTKVKQGKKSQKKADQYDELGNGKKPVEEVGFEEQLERLYLQLRELADGGSQERAKLLSHYPGELCALVQTISDKVKTETITELNILHEEKSKMMVEDHLKKTEELQRKHSEETQTHQAAEDALTIQNEELTTELQHYNQLKRRVEQSTFKKDLQRNIQARGSPGAFWESEQDSLVFVIEMKSERVQELGTKLLQMDALVEKNLSLEDQLVYVRQQNEDLEVRITSHQSHIQQLSAEQQQHQGALERLCQMNKRLGQDKEELIFKLKNRDSIHLPVIHSPR